MKGYKFARSCLILALTALAVLSVCGTPFAAEAAAGDVKAMSKGDYATDDTLKTWVPPNVFFLLDIGSGMTFTPKGRLPLDTDGHSTAEHAEWFAECTYGSGARPLSVNRNMTTGAWGEQSVGTIGTSGGYGRYGRDIDSSNNIIGDPDCYYTPYENMPYFLTFKSPLLARWDGQNSSRPNPSTVANELAAILGRYVNASEVNQLLNHYMDGITPVTDPALIEHLVPNDSRMYQMKLVMWRLLDENGRLLSRMKLALGTSYFETTYGLNYIADFYKVSPYDAGYYNSGGKWTTPAAGRYHFVNGAGPGWCDVNLPDGSQPYANSLKAYYGVDRDLYGSAQYTPGSSRFWRLNRARMLSPFDYTYEAQLDGTYTRREGLDYFRTWIDGIEDTPGVGSTANQNNPELFADGKTPLSGAIYGRDSLSGGSMLSVQDTDATVMAGDNTRSLVKYAKSSNTTTTYGTTGSVLLGTTHVVADDYSTNVRAGQAVGSIIDFFSPPGTGFSPMNLTPVGANNNIGYFPVIGSCQRNWLVIFTAANDSDGMTGAEAVRRLFEETRTIRGRRWNGSQWVAENYEMESGVRTLVVGFVDPDDMGDQSVALRETLTEMAQWGDPIVDPDDGTTSANPNAKPYFANDVPSLIASLKAVLTRINQTKYASASPTVDPDPVSAGADMLYYVPAYIATEYDQWEGYFDKYRVSTTTEVKDGELITKTTTTHLWEVNEKIANRVKSGFTRNLYMHGAVSGNESTAAVPMSAANLVALAGVPERENDFYKWLHDGTTTESALGDMEHSSYIITEGTANKTVFLQTNRGFLHAIDDSNGSERWAYVPPNAVPRLTALRYNAGSWITGTHITSNTLNLLDGPLTQRKLTNDNTLLFGNLGYGGAGVYVMDITNPSSNPKLLWAVDNARYATSGDVPGKVHRWGALAKATLSPGDYDYSDLGFTVAPASVIRVVGDVAILPGGIGYKLGADGDTQGKVIYVIEPETGKILQKLNSLVSPSSREMGMAIAAITFVRDNNGLTSEFYGADSIGNVLYCDTASWKLKSLFQILSSNAYANKPLAISKPVAAASASTAGGRWFFATTSEVMVPEDGLSRTISNPEQYVVAVKQAALSLSGGETSNSPGVTELSYEADWMDGWHSSHNDTADIGAPGFIGWKMMLRPALTDAKLGMEYVTTAPFIYEGMLFFSTFTPRVTAGENAEICPKLGDSKVYRMNPLTGGGMWSLGSRGIVIKNAKIAGMTATDGSLYISAKFFGTPTLEDIDPEERHNATILDDGEGNNPGLVIRLRGQASKIPAKIPFVHYWKETFGIQ